MLDRFCEVTAKVDWIQFYETNEDLHKALSEYGEVTDIRRGLLLASSWWNSLPVSCGWCFGISLPLNQCRTCSSLMIELRSWLSQVELRRVFPPRSRDTCVANIERRSATSVADYLAPCARVAGRNEADASHLMGEEEA